MKRLSFSIAINLLTENFKKNASTVKNYLRSIQMQIITFAAALGAGSMGLMGLVSRMKDVARETSRALTALKNVSGGAGLFADNLRFLNDLAKRYGVEINTLVFNFAKFKAAGDSVGMSLMDQRKIFEATSRAAVAYGMSAEDTNLTFLAITQMMSKGKISSEELRRQLGERLPIAMAAMAKAAGVPITKLDDLLKKGKLLSADVLPRFADALNEMIPNVDTDNIETSMNRLSNVFTKFTQAAGVGEKFKVLIDSLASIIDSAGKNIQNIILAIVASIVFVVTNGVTKIWRSYQAAGNQIIASAEAANVKMVTATAARVEAEIALEKAKSAALLATDKQRLQAQAAVTKAETTLRNRSLAETKAINAEKVASAQAAAVKTGGAWATTGAMIKGTFLKLTAALKSMWSTFAPAIIISGIIAIGMHLKNVYDEAKRIKNIFSDYKKEASVAGNTQEVKMLQTQLSIMNDKTKSQNAINSAQSELNRMLGVEGKNQEELNKLVAKRVELLKAAAQADFYARKSVETEDKIRELSASIGLDEDEVKTLATIRGGVGASTAYFERIGKAYQDKGVKGIYDSKAADAAIKEITELMKVSRDADEQLAGFVNQANSLTPDSGGSSGAGTNKTIDRRLEALRKLDEADKQRQIDKLAFDNRMRQKAIDNMLDSFKKEEAQLKLNNEKELQEIEEFKKKISKAQYNEIKNQYIAKHGNTKGFEPYLKDVNLSDVLPDGLKPEDVADQVQQLTDAASATLQTGLSKLNKEIATFQDEERLRFASGLNQQLYDIRSHYNDRLQLAKGNAKLTKQLEENQRKETKAAILQSIGKQLDFELQYNQKVKDLRSDRYVFETDKRRAALEQEIKDQKNIFNNLEKQVLNDPNNDELANQLRNAFIELKRLNKELEKTNAEKLKEVAEAASEIFTSLRSALDDFGISFSEDINKALDGIGQTLDGLASIDLNKPVSAITGGLTALGGVFKAITGIFGIGGADYSGYNKLKDKYDNLIEIWDELLNKKKEYLSTSTADEVNRTEQEILDLIKIQEGTAKALARERLSSGTSMGSHSLWYRMWKGSYKFEGQNWRDVAGDISSSLGGVKFTSMDDMLNMTADQLQWIKENYYGLWSVMDGDFRGYLEQLIQYGDQAIETIEAGKEILTGVSFDSLKDSFLNTLMDMDSSAEDFAEDFQSYLQKAILKSMLDKSYAQRLQSFYDSFADANRIGGIDSNEYAQLKEDWNNLVNDALEEREKLKDIFGWDSSSSSSSQKASSGGFESMSQDTASALEGRFTGLQMSGIKIEQYTKGMLESGLRIESLLSGISFNGNLFQQPSSTTNEMLKHTELFNDMRQIQLKSFFELEGTNKTLKNINERLTNIEQNTKGLI